MDNLNFGNNYNSTSSSYSNVSSGSGEQKSFMVEFLIKRGIVKDQKTGNAILLTFALLMFALSGYMIKNSLFPSPATISVEDSSPSAQTE